MTSLADRVVLLVLDDHGPRLAVDGHVEDGGAGHQHARAARARRPGTRCTRRPCRRRRRRARAPARRRRRVAREPRSVRSSTFSSGRLLAAIAAARG